MKINKARKDTRTRHHFDLAGQPASIRAVGYDFDIGIAFTSVTVAGHKPVYSCYFGIVTKGEVPIRLRHIRKARKLGIERPDVKCGAVVDAGIEHNFDEGVQVLCLLVGLDPDDCTDFDYVDLTVRAAAVALARKITLRRRRKRTVRQRLSLSPKAFNPFEI